MKFPTNDMRVVEFDDDKVDAFGLEVFEDQCRALRAEKEEVCKRRPQDITAHITYLPMQRSSLYLIVPATIGFDLPMQELIGMTLMHLGKEIGEPRLIGLAADAAMKVFAAADENRWPNVARGSILAGLGRDPQIRETLTVSVVHRRHETTELRALDAVMPYHYDGRTLVWDDDDGYRMDSLENDGKEVGGGIAEIVRQAFVKGGN